MEFPHITNSEFPNVPSALDPVNDFDYERWAEYETKITMCNVPWGTSEVQVGQRVTGGLGKVVKFKDDLERDLYFDDLPNKIVLTTPYRGFSQDSLQVNVPFDMLVNYNYCYIEYSPATAEDVLLDYEGVNGIRRIYYFIRDMRYHSPSNTELLLLLDYWTTFINSIEWVSLGIERGHAPVKGVTVEQYLNNPMNNCEYLLHEDICATNPGIRSADSEQYVFNGGVQYALITSTADLIRTLQNGKEKTLCNNIDSGDTLNLYTAAVDIADLETLVGLVNTRSPQFIATVQGVYIVENTYLNLGSAVNISGVSIYPVNGGKIDLSATYTFNKGSFKLDNKYAGLAKLYTYPYSYLEVTDWRGGVHVVRVEDCPGTLTIETMSNIAAPFIALQAAILGVGGGARNDITFKNVKTLHYISQGREHDYTFTWPMPCYAITQQPSIDYDIHTVHDRAQRAEENATSQANALDSNATTNTNALASNDTVYTNQDNNIQRIKDNVDRELKLQSTIKNRNNNLIDDETSNNLQKLSDDLRADILASMAIVGAENEATAITASHNQAMGIVGNAAMGAVSGATAGSIVPGVGTVAGAVVGAVGGTVAGVVGAEQIGFSAMVSMTTNEELAEASRDNARLKGQSAIDHATSSQTIRKNYNNECLVANNQAVLDISGRNKEVDDNANTASKNTGDANANRTKATADGIANRTKATADNAITRAVEQAGLGEPRLFGNYLGGNDTNIKPLGLDFSIITQDKASIAYAGEQFLRYGYYVNRWYNFNGFNLCDKFTYWKCFDFVTGAIRLPDAFVDRIKALLLGGITVYSKPEYITEATLYNNGL